MRRFARRLAALGMLLIAAAAAAQDWRGVADALDFTPHGTQPGLGYYLRSSNECRNCHRGTQPGDATAMPYNTWAGSMMANATRDPLFWAALDVANNDVPGAGDFCLRCHTPRGWFGGHVVKGAFGGANDVTLGSAGCLLSGRYDSADDLDSDFGGTTCHYCHRLMPQGPLGEPGYIGNANAWLDDGECENTGEFEPCRRGPYTYTGDGSQPPHAWVQSAYHAQSAICGLCHDVSTPDTSSGPLKTLKLANGIDTGLPFPIERTFSEWQQSAFADVVFRDGLDPAVTGQAFPAKGAVCQTCHMPSSEDPDASACVFSGFPSRTGNLPVHAFAGGNTWVPGILKGQYGAGIVANGGIDRSEAFDQTIAWARQMLAGAASLSTTIQGSAGRTLPVVVERDGKDVTLQVTPKKTQDQVTDQKTGHTVTKDVGMIGITPTNVFQPQPLGTAITATGQQLGQVTGVFVNLPQRMVGIWNAAFGAGERSASSPVGIIGVGRMAGEIADSSTYAFVSKIQLMLSLLASLNLVVDTPTFPYLYSLILLAVMAIAGRRTVPTAIVGALAYQVLPGYVGGETFRNVREFDDSVRLSK